MPDLKIFDNGYEFEIITKACATCIQRFDFWN